MSLPLREMLRRLGPADAPAVTDRELLERYLARRDEGAFEAILRRHGGMVWAVCRRLLPHVADAEDAFQATFLVLVRKAPSLRRADLLGNWLYGVAHRTALKARHGRARSPFTAGPCPDLAGPTRGPEVEHRELLAVLDDELSRLPARYRLPLVLCCLEGRSKAEAAAATGWPEGTVSSRLARGRDLLRRRLLRRGVGAPAALLALAVSDKVAAAPPALARATLLAALGKAPGVPISTLTLAEGVMRTMFLSRVRNVVLVLAAACLPLGGVAALAWQQSTPAKAVATAEPDRAAPQEEPRPPSPKPAQARPAAPLDEKKALLGVWKQVNGDRLNLVRFEPGRMTQFRDGNRWYTRIRVEDGRIIRLGFAGQREPLEKFEVSDDVLVLLDPGGRRHRFERLEKEPAELTVAPVVIGERGDVSAEKAREVRQELARREAANLRVRQEWRQLAKDRDKAAAKLAEMHQIDADDTKYLTGLVKELGWIDARRFGDKAAHGAYPIVMHTKDHALTEAALPELEKEVKAKRFDAEQFAGLFDRWRTVTARPERYGMHVTPDDQGALTVGPLEDRSRVDEWRKEIGLPPLAKYLERYRAENGGKDVKVLDD